ncbi:50S ribosomal protein L24 [Lacunimicrobium album]
MKIKKGDSIVVVSGDDAGNTPKRVLEVLAKGEKVLVEGVNVVFKHVRKGHPKSPAGGRLQLEKPIHSSNVMFYCEGCSKPTRLGYRFTTDGSKERFCKKCSKSAGIVSPAKTKYAQSK